VRHAGGDPAHAQAVDIAWADARGELRTVRARHVVLACFHRVIPFLCPEVPAAQVAALTLAPLRALIAGGAPALVPLAGFGVGFALPWLFGRLGDGDLIVYRGASAVGTPATGWFAAAAAPQP